VKNLLIDVPSRKYEVSAGLRMYSVDGPRRSFISYAPKRDFGVAIIGWRLWGQTDIYPFQTGGVDSTKTFGELP
jgi:hypothetical protein